MPPTHRPTWTIEPGVVGVVDKDVGAEPEGAVCRSFCAKGCLRRLVREGIHGEGDKAPNVGLDGPGCLVGCHLVIPADVSIALTYDSRRTAVVVLLLDSTTGAYIPWEYINRCMDLFHACFIMYQGGRE